MMNVFHPLSLCCPNQIKAQNEQKKNGGAENKPSNISSLPRFENECTPDSRLPLTTNTPRHSSSRLLFSQNHPQFSLKPSCDPTSISPCFFPQWNKGPFIGQLDADPEKQNER